jgi:hypothetical protein
MDQRPVTIGFRIRTAEVKDGKTPTAMHDVQPAKTETPTAALIGTSKLSVDVIEMPD